MIFIANLIIPTIVAVIVGVGLIEKKDIYNIFCDGAKDGMKIMLKMFPTLIGIFLAINMLRSCEILDYVSYKISFLTQILKIPNEIIPLMFIKPISGSASMAMATDLIKTYGVDSIIGMIAATIMSSSETTFYVIALYLGSINLKNSGKIVIPALLADITTIIVAIMIIK